MKTRLQKTNITKVQMGNIGGAAQATKTQQLQMPTNARLFEPWQQMDEQGALQQRGLQEKAAIEHLACDLLNHLTNLGTDNPDELGLILTQIYGDKLTSEKRESLVQQASSGAMPMPANVSFVDAEVLKGADAAYSEQEGGTVFLSRDLKTDPDRLQAAFQEEVGHHLDRVIGGPDALGDEGQLFQIAIAQGKPLTSAALRAGHLNLDRGTIEVDGKQYPVEFRADLMARHYEARSTFNAMDRRAGANDRLSKQVDKALVAKFATPDIKNIDDVKAHCEAEGIDFGLEQMKAQNAFVSEYAGRPLPAEKIDEALIAKFADQQVEGHPVASIDDVTAHLKANGGSYASERATVEQELLAPYVEKYVEATGAKVATEAHAATMMVKLIAGKVLPEETELQTRLPGNVQGRVNNDEALKQIEPKIRTYGALLAGITGDIDGDQRIDVDALQLGRFLPGSSQQTILKALKRDMDGPELKEKLSAIGFDNAITNAQTAKSVLSMEAPVAFGLAGETRLDRVQQQLLLRTGKVFLDSDQDGKVSDDDKVHFVDANGALQETTFKELSQELKTLVKYNMATAMACDEYAAQPSYQRMKFPHYHSNTGESDPERVNEDFWTVSEAHANRNQVSWELAEGKLPSDAINDPFSGNGGKYTTECAHGRTMVRLKGRLNYYTNEYGKGEGAFRFNAVFAKGNEDKQKIEEYLKGFEDFKAENEGKTWDDYVEAHPTPEISYGIEVSRHRVFGHNESVITPFKSADVDAGPGDTGYFHNYSVTIEGVKIGYVGENVIDLGFQNGVRRFWGHPGGVKTEKSWQSSLASRRIKLQSMSEYGQYFSSLYMKRDAARVSKSRIEGIEKEIKKLEADKPEGWEDQVKTHQDSIGWWKALGAVRGIVAEAIDPKKSEEAKKFYESNPSLVKPEGTADLLATLTEAGVTRSAAAFDQLGEETKKQVAEHYGKPLEELDDKQKAMAALQATLTAGGTRVHQALREEGLQAIRNIAFNDKADWLKPGGNMGSKQDFAAWIKTDGFKDWYKEKTGNDYEGKTEPAKMTKDEIRKLVEIAFPMVSGMRTIYADVNRGTQLVSAQMAEMLKEGKLPDAEYAIDSHPVMPN